MTIEEGRADTEEVNRGIAVLWYTDNLLYAENDMGTSPESGFYSGIDFFARDSDIEFVLHEDFTIDDASALERALEP